MSDQTFEQSLLTLRGWLDFLDREEERLEAQLQRLRRVNASVDEEESALLNPAEPTLNPDGEEDDWL